MLPLEKTSKINKRTRMFIPDSRVDNFSYLGNTIDKIGNVRAHCPDSSQLFFLAEPFFNTDSFFVRHGNIDCQMLESL